MSKPKKQKKLPKPAAEMTGDEVMKEIFGPDVQEALKEKANPTTETNDQPTDRV